MLQVFLVGAVGGALCGAKRYNRFPGLKQGEAPTIQGDGSNSTTSSSSGCKVHLSKCATAVAACAGVAVTCCLLAQQHRRKSGKSGRPDRRNRHEVDGRIPLQDLIRFKERQWFVEELENARDADPNAMLRLAKMYLHGQGCQINIALAQEWVRKARNMGVPATLDELYATDDPDPRGRLRALAAAEEKRRMLRRMTPPYTQQHLQTAAA